MWIWLYDHVGPTWPVFVIPVFILALKAFSNLFETPADPTPREVSKTLKAFLDGKLSDGDWDDFICIKIKEPGLDAIRARCAGLSHEFPSPDRRAYCSEEGLDVLRSYIAQLDATA